MLQLHQQVYCLLNCALSRRVDGVRFNEQSKSTMCAPIYVYLHPRRSVLGLQRACIRLEESIIQSLSVSMYSYKTTPISPHHTIHHLYWAILGPGNTPGFYYDKRLISTITTRGPLRLYGGWLLRVTWCCSSKTMLNKNVSGDHIACTGSSEGGVPNKSKWHWDCVLANTTL